MKQILLSVAAIALALHTYAQAPQQLSYQAVVRDASNALVVNAPVGTQVSILQGTSTGTAVYVETHTTTTNANGLATFEIGAGTVLTGTMAGIDWANGPYFLKTETDPTGGTNYTLVATSQLLSVPYALYAANSGSNANAWDIAGNATTGNNNKLGTLNAQDLHIVTNSTERITIMSGNGNVGIGQLLPSAKLDVLGDVQFSGALKANGITGNTGQVLTSQGAGVAPMWTAITNGTNGKNSLIKTTNEPAGVNCANGGTLIESGVDADNSGILDVGEVTATKYICNGMVGPPGVTGATGLNGTNASGQSITDSITAQAWGLKGNNTNASAIFGTLNAQDLHIVTNSTERITIMSGNGNVGIGQLLPSAKLDVLGDVQFYGALKANGITGTTGEVLTSQGAGVSPIWTTPSAGSGWSLTGNSATSAGLNFIGTTDNVDVMFKRNGIKAGLLNSTNTAFGISALNIFNTGSFNTAIGLNSLASNTTGNGNTALGNGANVATGALNNATALGNGAITNASDKVVVGNTAVTVIGGQVGWSTLSDARLKSNVKDYSLGLNFITKLNPKSYTYNNSTNGVVYNGLLAQDVEKTLQELGVEFSGVCKPQTTNDNYSIRYGDFVIPLINAVKEQQEQIKALIKEIEQLKKSK